MFDNYFWSEKYRPRKVDDVILPASIKDRIKEQIANSATIPSLLFYGPGGIGKTTLAIALSLDFDYEYLLLNCSDEGRLLDTFRNKVTNFCTAVSLEGKRKCLILDEIDNAPGDIQKLLRGFMEKYSGNCTFIATCNFVNALIEPLQSRFKHISFSISAEEKQKVVVKTFKRVIEILEIEKVAYDKEAVSKFVGKYFPDFRRMLNEIQFYGGSGKIDSGIFATSDMDITKLFEYLKGRNWNDMRKWAATQANLDMPYICRSLYLKAPDLMKNESLPSLAILIAEFQFKHAFVVDKEINVVAFLTQVMANCEFIQ